MAEKEDPELTLFHRHTEATTTCIAMFPENNLKNGRIDLPQLVVERKPHQKEYKEQRHGQEPNPWCN